MKILDPKIMHNLDNGTMEGNEVNHYVKKYKDVKNLYKSNKEYDSDTIVYEVYSSEQGDSSIEGNLNWGMTVMYPVFIEGECNMTRGHFHENKNCAEYYFGIEGEGLLILMDENGEMWSEKILRGSLHYIDGKYAHRMVNTGETILKVGACWPTTAGHDYETIEKMEFPYRIYKNYGKIEFIKR